MYGTAGQVQHQFADRPVGQLFEDLGPQRRAVVQVDLAPDGDHGRVADPADARRSDPRHCHASSRRCSSSDLPFDSPSAWPVPSVRSTRPRFARPSYAPAPIRRKADRNLLWLRADRHRVSCLAPCNASPTRHCRSTSGVSPQHSGQRNPTSDPTPCSTGCQPCCASIPAPGTWPGRGFQPGDHDSGRRPVLGRPSAGPSSSRRRSTGPTAASASTPTACCGCRAAATSLVGGPRERQFGRLKQWAASVAGRAVRRPDRPVRALRRVAASPSTRSSTTRCRTRRFLEFDVLDTATDIVPGHAPPRRTLLAGVPVTSVPVLYAGPATTLTSS